MTSEEEKELIRSPFSNFWFAKEFNRVELILFVIFGGYLSQLFDYLFK